MEELVARAMSDPGFVDLGVHGGRRGALHWAVIDPARHPFAIRRVRLTRRAVSELGAAAVSNGPLMGRRVFGWKVTRSLLAAVPVVTGAIVGTAAPGLPIRRRVAVGTMAGAAVAGFLLTGWEPCGVVRAAGASIDDRRDFDGEGPSHAWFGQFSTDGQGSGFAALHIGDGELPEAAVEGAGGLVRLVRDHHREREGDVVRLAGRHGVVAWGLVPTAPDGSDGVVLVVGSATLDVAVARDILHEARARDAVATDPSGSSLLGIGTDVVVGPPSWVRRRIQRYALVFGGPCPDQRPGGGPR